MFGYRGLVVLRGEEGRCCAVNGLQIAKPLKTLLLKKKSVNTGLLRIPWYGMWYGMVPQVRYLARLSCIVFCSVSAVVVVVHPYRKLNYSVECRGCNNIHAVQVPERQLYTHRCTAYILHVKQLCILICTHMYIIYIYTTCTVLHVHLVPVHVSIIYYCHYCTVYITCII